MQKKNINKTLQKMSTYWKYQEMYQVYNFPLRAASLEMDSDTKSTFKK